MRSNLVVITIVLFVGLTRPYAAAADDSLTIELPPSQRALDARAAVKAQQAASNAAASQSTSEHRIVRVQSSEPSQSRGSLPYRGGGQDRVVGRLGEVQQRTSITRGSFTLATVQPGTYIAIKQDSARSYAVLMADGSTGWISKRAVKVLDYQVVSNGAPSVPDIGGQPLAARTGSEFFAGDPEGLLREAYKYMGVPYQWGGNTASGIDCSGFMKKVFASCGYPLPRTAAEQTNVGMPVPVDSLQCGDRLYFGHGGRITHTGLYIGNGYFIHSSSGEHGVAISRLSDQPYQRIFSCARR